MLEKEITYFRQKTKVICDGKCEKAWGINNRPQHQLDINNEDDYVFLSDDELGIAPVDPGTYECDCAKPSFATERLNKWCCRECERSSVGKEGEELIAKDFSIRVYNIPR